MPTGLQTTASTPNPRPPEVRAKTTLPASRSGPEFSRTLREKRTDVGVDATADPVVQPDTTSITTDRPGTSDQSRVPGSDQPRDAARQADAAAQGGREMAQVLPIAPRLPVPAAVQNQVASQSPGEAAQAALNSVAPQLQVASQLPGEAAQAALNSVAPQLVNTQGEADPLPPVQTVPAARPERSSGETQQQSTGTGTQSGGNEGQPGANHPAIGRAMQVQAAVAVENIAGHPVLGGPPATVVASGSSGQPLLQQATGLNAEDAPTTGRVIRGLTAMLQQRGGSMTMRLDPPALGQLRVQMTIARGVVTADFQPGTLEAQALLERSIATLRSALESQGLTVERLTVHAAPSSTSARETADDQSQQGNQSSRNHSDAGDGRSRGRGDDSRQQDTSTRRSPANFADAFEAQAAATTDNLSDRTGAQAA